MAKLFSKVARPFGIPAVSYMVTSFAVIGSQPENIDILLLLIQIQEVRNV